MKTESKYFIFDYSINDLTYIDDLIEYLYKEIIGIISFFELNKFGNKIQIHLFDNVNKLWDLHDNLYDTRKRFGEVPNWICGFSVKDDVFTLCLEELRKTKNKDKANLDELKSLILHEVIHSIHSKVNLETTSSIWLSEGLATTLSHQYDCAEIKLDSSIDDILIGNCYYYNYNAIFQYILNNYDKKFILNLINDSTFLKNEENEILYSCIKYYRQKSIRQ